MSAIEEFIKHEDWCAFQKFWRDDPICDCGKDKVDQEIATLQARITELEGRENLLREVAEYLVEFRARDGQTDAMYGANAAYLVAGQDILSILKNGKSMLLGEKNS